jgi:hypothetical protein
MPASGMVSWTAALCWTGSMRRMRVNVSSCGETQKTRYGRPRGSPSVQAAGKVSHRDPLDREGGLLDLFRLLCDGRTGGSDWAQAGRTDGSAPVRRRPAGRHHRGPRVLASRSQGAYQDAALGAAGILPPPRARRRRCVASRRCSSGLPARSPVGPGRGGPGRDVAALPQRHAAPAARGRHEAAGVLGEGRQAGACAVPEDGRAQAQLRLDPA